MDRIEELMRAADPAREVPGPRPFRVAEITSPATRPARRRSREHLAVWGGAVGVAAALAGGLVIANQWQTTPDAPAQPAEPDGSAPVVTDPPSTPSPSGDAARLPNGLVPAHDDVYLEDSAACDALDVTQVRTSGPDGEPLATEPWEYPVVGCVDGVAALQMSDRWFYESGVDDIAMGIVLARWADGTWTMEGAHETPDGELDLRVYSSWPTLIGYELPGDPPAAERMAEQYAEIGVDAVTGERLLGPETVVWTVDTPAESWTPGGADRPAGSQVAFLWRSDAVWHGAGSASTVLHDGSSSDAVKDAGDRGQEVFTYFDPRGKNVAQLLVSTHPQGSGGCALPNSTYVIEGRAATALESPEGRLDVALVTWSDGVGVEVSTAMLVPGSAPDTGARCDLPAEHTVGDRVVRFDGGRYQFRNDDERAAYLDSQEFADVVRLGTSITMD
ncbi:hypothetical protein [Georgenia subflava]|uniref:Uncharacterized protein n=1 Tax=Georgenia subflava TaxID=1622177 RepID=A0A6N7EG09_9MICO|nr:hypothetical protein [Georgenia subflava]MPV37332.1 hypothetical protein [Georgenia subflava]